MSKKSQTPLLIPSKNLPEGASKEGQEAAQVGQEEAKGCDGDNDGDGLEDHEIDGKKRPNPPTLIPSKNCKKRTQKQRPHILTLFA